MNPADQAGVEQSVGEMEIEQFYSCLRALMKQGTERGFLVKPHEPWLYRTTARRIVFSIFVLFAIFDGHLSHAAQTAILLLFGLFWALAAGSANQRFRLLCSALDW